MTAQYKRQPLQQLQHTKFKQPTTARELRRAGITLEPTVTIGVDKARESSKSAFYRVAYGGRTRQEALDSVQSDFRNLEVRELASIFSSLRDLVAPVSTSFQSISRDLGFLVAFAAEVRDTLGAPATALPPDHPDAGKTVRPARLSRSMSGVSVTDIREVDGSVSRSSSLPEAIIKTTPLRRKLWSQPQHEKNTHKG